MPAQPLRRRIPVQAAAAEEQDAMVAGTGGAKSGAVDPKLVALRQQMATCEGGKGVDVYIVPTEDPHMVRGSRIIGLSRDLRSLLLLFILYTTSAAKLCANCAAGPAADSDRPVWWCLQSGWRQCFGWDLMSCSEPVWSQQRGMPSCRAHLQAVTLSSVLTAECCACFLQSEYAPPNQERRHYISGFTGSAGTVVVTKDQALLWTDGRYFLQVRCRGRMYMLHCFPYPGRL